MTFGIAALAAWGARRFQNLLAGIELPLASTGDTAQQIAGKSAQIQSDITNAGVNLFSDFYFAGAVVCLIAVLPCIPMKVNVLIRKSPTININGLPGDVTCQVRS